MLLRALSMLLIFTLLCVLAGCDTRSVIMGNDPEADLVCTPDNGIAPLDVVLDASASTDDGNIVEYAFMFGDAGAGEPWFIPDPPTTAVLPAHTYTGEDVDYTAHVRVTDDGGNTDIATANVHLNASVDEPPVAALTASPSSGDAPLDVVLDASASTDDGNITKYEFRSHSTDAWVDQGMTPTWNFNYSAAGNYLAAVRVTDDAATPQTDTQTAPIGVGGASGSNEICLNIGYTNPGGFTPAGGAPIRLYNAEPSDPADPGTPTFPPEFPIDQVAWNYTDIGNILQVCFENVPDGTNYWVYWHKGDLVDWEPGTPGDQLYQKLGPFTVPPDYNHPDIMGEQLKEPMGGP